MHIGQAKTAALVEVGQAFVVNPQQASLNEINSDGYSCYEYLIWDSLNEPEIKAREATWTAESERWIDAYDSGKLTARPAADVFTGLKKNLRSETALHVHCRTGVGLFVARPHPFPLPRGEGTAMSGFVELECLPWFCRRLFVAAEKFARGGN